MSAPIEFQPFAKISRLSREVVVTEKIDGTNAQIYIVKSCERAEVPGAVAIYRGDAMNPDDVDVYAGSRNRWLAVGNDNYGFASWVASHVEELKLLGPGRHFGEWWGAGIQRKYGQTQKRFSLFNVGRWAPAQAGNPFSGVFCTDPTPEQKCRAIECCHVVPTIWRGIFDTGEINDFIEMLRIEGSFAAPGFKDPEGIVIYHTASGTLFKKTLKDDETPKTLVNGPVLR